MRVTLNNIKKDFTIFRKIFMTIVSAFIAINGLAAQQPIQAADMDETLDQLSYARTMGYWGPISQLSLRQSINNRPAGQTTNLYFDKKGNILSAELIDNTTGMIEMSMKGNDVFSSMYETKCHEAKSYINSQNGPTPYYAIVDDQSGIILYLVYFDEYLRPDIMLYPVTETRHLNSGIKLTSIDYYMAKMEYDPNNIRKLNRRKILFDVTTPNNQELLFDYKYIDNILSNWDNEKQVGLVEWNASGSDQYGNPSTATYITYNIDKSPTGKENRRLVQEECIQYTQFKYFMSSTSNDVNNSHPDNNSNTDQQVQTESDTKRRRIRGYTSAPNYMLPSYLMVKNATPVRKAPFSTAEILSVRGFNDEIILQPGDVVEIISTKDNWAKVRLYCSVNNYNWGYVQRRDLDKSDTLPQDWYNNEISDSYGISLGKGDRTIDDKYIVMDGEVVFINDIAIRYFADETGDDGICRRGYAAISYCDGQLHATYNIYHLYLIQGLCKILHDAINSFEIAHDMNKFNNISNETHQRVNEITSHFPSFLREMKEYDAANKAALEYQRKFASRFRELFIPGMIKAVREETSIEVLNTIVDSAREILENIDNFSVASSSERHEINNGLKQLSSEVEQRIKQLSH